MIGSCFVKDLAVFAIEALAIFLKDKKLSIKDRKGWIVGGVERLKRIYNGDSDCIL